MVYKTERVNYLSKGPHVSNQHKSQETTNTEFKELHVNKIQLKLRPGAVVLATWEAEAA